MEEQLSLDNQEDVQAATVGSITDDFVSNLEGLRTSLPLVMWIMEDVRSRLQESYGKFLQETSQLIDEDAEAKTYEIPPEHARKASSYSRQVKEVAVGCEILPQSFIVSLISQYDLFLGRLVREFFVRKPELLNSSERRFTLSQLLEFESMQEAQEYIIEKETESLIRSSHVEQFTWLENRFDIKLHEDLPVWPCFVEVTERRNLFVHTGGVVSTQYLQNAKKHGANIPETCRVGHKLSVDPQYFRTAYACVFEIGVKLAQVLWRKLLPDELELADDSLNCTIFDLLASERFALAITMGAFAVQILKKHANDEIRRMLLINWAQAYKWHEEPAKCEEILNKEDWSASSDSFRLAVSVLKDDYETAAKLMKRIGANGGLKEVHYKTWPLFRQFREKEEFLQAFEDIFGKPFTEIAKSEAPQLSSSEDQCQVQGDEAEEGNLPVGDTPELGQRTNYGLWKVIDDEGQGEVADKPLGR